MRVKVNRVYQDAYSVFKRRFASVPGRPLEPVLAWKELDELYSSQFSEVVPGLERLIKAMQDVEMKNHLDDTAALVKRMEFLRSNAHEVLYSQLCALRKAWSDMYVTVGHDGEFVMTTDLCVGTGLRGSLVTIDDMMSGSVLCALEEGEGEVYLGAPVRVGGECGYLRHNGLSSTPSGRVCRMPLGEPELLYPKLNRK